MGLGIQNTDIRAFRYGQKFLLFLNRTFKRKTDFWYRTTLSYISARPHNWDFMEYLQCPENLIKYIWGLL